MNEDILTISTKNKGKNYDCPACKRKFKTDMGLYHHLVKSIDLNSIENCLPFAKMIIVVSNEHKYRMLKYLLEKIEYKLDFIKCYIVEIHDGQEEFKEFRYEWISYFLKDLKKYNKYIKLILG